MKHLTLFLSICWLFWFSQIFAISTICGFSDIPAASVIALGNNVSELVNEKLTTNDSEEDISSSSSTAIPSDLNIKKNISSTIIQNENMKSEKDFIVISEVKSTLNSKENSFQDNISSDDEYKPIIIDDSGAKIDIKTKTKDVVDEEASFLTASNNDEIQQQSSTVSASGTSTPSSTATTSEVNLTVEENPIPVFSEWAQKQMEEAEKKLEKQVMNTSSSKKNTTGGNKPTLVKLRAKNYASPDCGAKIIASNSEAQNTGALLSSSKDEYMLSPCTSRIWFVIELCEAIQLEKVDLANFELFSSSPKNFSVSISSRFPTREWSNVGRFLAEDNRQIQSFNLYPHLFGKFVRVDVHSHYNSEHFCPISLFHVYGTSEFEAFETENRQSNDDLDDDNDDDEFDELQLQQQQHGQIKIENNLFKSASDAVMSIVKKAAEVLVKTNSNKTGNDDENSRNNLTKLENEKKSCFTPKVNFVCEKCNQTFVDSVNYLLSCKHLQFIDLLNDPMIKDVISKSSACNRILNGLIDGDSNDNVAFNKEKNDNFLLNILPLHYQVALCHLIETINLKNNSKLINDENDDGKDDAPFNLTIDKKYENEFIKTEKQLHSRKQKQQQGQLKKSSGTESFQTKEEEDLESKTGKQFSDNSETNENSQQEIDSQNESYIPTQIPEPPTKSSEHQQAENIENFEPTENVNIFNIVDKYTPPSDTLTQQQQEQQQQVEEQIDGDKKHDENDSSLESSATPSSSSSQKVEEVTTTTSTSSTKSKDAENNEQSWDSIDKLLSEQTTSDNLNSNSNNEGGQSVQRVQSESIFIRLSNRIKALERNMSLSGQYLEELSRRYKKQVEELQHSFTKTLSAIEEQNRNAQEREHVLSQQYKSLGENVTELTIRFNSLIICLIPLIIFQFVVSWIFIRSYRRRCLEFIQRYEENVITTNKQRPTKKLKKLSRRKSIESVIIVEKPTKPVKVRRPSEEAMRISGSYKDLLILDDDDDGSKGNENSTAASNEPINGNGKKLTAKQRQRKLSIFYGKAGNQNNQNLKYDRLESVSEDLTNLSVATSSTLNSSIKDGSEVILDDDYESYIPGTDLAYNEFMPEGPSGDGSNNRKLNGNVAVGLNINAAHNNDNSNSKSKKSGKFRKLSSPKFLKASFGGKHDSTKKLSHGPTGWEWYRSKKSIDNLHKSSPPSSTIDNDDEIRNLLATISRNGQSIEKINGILSSSTNSSFSSDLLRINYNSGGDCSSSKGSDESMRLSTNEISSTSPTATDSQLKNDFEEEI